MNLGHIRNKQRQLHRVLESIPVPSRNAKAVTEAHEQPIRINTQKQTFDIRDNKDIRPSRRYSRGRHLVTEEQHSLAKYKSLDMGSRPRKVSQPKLEWDGRLERDSGQYESHHRRSVRKKLSGQTIPINQSIPFNQSINDRYFLKSKSTSKRDPAEIKAAAGQLIKKGQFLTALTLLNQSE